MIGYENMTYHIAHEVLKKYFKWEINTTTNTNYNIHHKLIGPLLPFYIKLFPNSLTVIKKKFSHYRHILKC